MHPDENTVYAAVPAWTSILGTAKRSSSARMDLRPRDSFRALTSDAHLLSTTINSSLSPSYSTTLSDAPPYRAAASSAIFPTNHRLRRRASHAVARTFSDAPPRTFIYSSERRTQYALIISDDHRPPSGDSRSFRQPEPPTSPSSDEPHYFSLGTLSSPPPSIQRRSSDMRTNQQQRRSSDMRTPQRHLRPCSALTH